MTYSKQIARPRYDEGCLAAHALNVVGDRWALLVVRELMLAPKRFMALRQGMPGVSAAVLTQRLNQLLAAEVVVHDPAVGLYDLTVSGRGLLPVLQAMCRWGALHPGHDPRRFISPTALMISMTAMVDTSAARGLLVRAGFRFADEAFVMRLDSHGVLHAQAALQPEADFLIEGSGNTVARAVYGPVSVVDLASEGVIGLGGDAVAAQGFVDLFRLRP